MKGKMKYLLLAMAVVVMVLGTQVSSYATAALGLMDLSVGGAGVKLVFDNGTGDLNPLPGVITFNGIWGNWAVNVTTGLTKPDIGSPFDAEMDLNSINQIAQLATGGELVVGLSDVGFTDSGAFLFKTGGTLDATAGSSVLFSYYLANGNTLFTGSITPPVDLLGTLGPFGPGAFSATGSGFQPVTGPHSLTILADIVITNTDGKGHVSFDSDLHSSVPEPISLILLGTGLAGAGFYRRLRKPKS